MSVDIEYSSKVLREIEKRVDTLGSAGDGVSIDAYLDEAYRAVLKEGYKQMLKPYYRGEVVVGGKRISLFEVHPSYLPENVLGMTDGFSSIWLRNDLNDMFGYDVRRRVLEHEKEHVRDPAADETTVRKRTNTVSIGSYSMN